MLRKNAAAASIGQKVTLRSRSAQRFCDIADFHRSHNNSHSRRDHADTHDEDAGVSSRLPGVPISLKSSGRFSDTL
jgi:hypothetical protein